MAQNMNGGNIGFAFQRVGKLAQTRAVFIDNHHLAALRHLVHQRLPAGDMLVYYIDFAGGAARFFACGVGCGGVGNIQRLRGFGGAFMVHQIACRCLMDGGFSQSGSIKKLARLKSKAMRTRT
ncbi:hypothetical protein O6D90_18540 [Citrobacter sp. 21OH12SH02A-Citro]|nr:hypothetical protein [Citrobacter sp. 21OH12SH02A-Citro]WBA63830.1 hypothetical protein O6D90_18540 [Citrobacter sp. 21OH12SH02A-Citro]